MRIIGGQHKGFKLEPIQLKQGQIRPTSDRLRETIFNILQHSANDYHKIENANTLDLFSGTGALGIEALSRGANHCCFVEINKKACSLIAQNLHKLKISDRAKIINMDASCFKLPIDLTKIDLVFADPPYGQGLAGLAIKRLLRLELLHEGSTIIIEEEAGSGFKPSEKMVCTEHRIYGKSEIYFLKKL